jgi:light-regulated signal transduction histidine kinase (bacteriophytochrome)
MKVKKNLFTSINEYLKRQSSLFLLIWGLILILSVGSVDYITGQEIDLVIFYLLPISLAAWFANRNIAIILCLISSAVEFLANAAAGRTYSHSLIAFWNSAVSFGFFLLYVFILSTLKKEYEKRIKLIKELKDSLAELNHTKEKLEQMSRDLSRSNDDLKQFAYAASHDLQEPLRVVAGYVNLLARRYKSKLDANADEFVEYIVDGVKRMEALIKDLLEYSQVGIKEKHFEPIESSLAVGLAVGNLQATIEEYGAIVTYDELPTVTADFSQMSRLFQNLIGNAIKYRGNESPKVHISAGRNGKEWIFSVKDNGIGIDPKNLERIFIIFQRLHGREEYPGTGIGLTTCKKIVERHGGRIWAESEPGKGSIFYFTIPKEK